MRHLNNKVLALGVYLVVVAGMVQSAVNLTPVGTITVDENNPATLTCTYVGSETDLLFKWIKIIGDVGGVDDIIEGSILTSTCTVLGSAINSTKYSYSCSGSQQVTWTIKNVDRSNNEDRWRCLVSTSTGTENSSVVSIDVRVPIQSVTMTQPASDTTIDIVENTPTTFTCRADGLPSADIKWYKVNGTPSTSNVGTQITYTGSTTIVTSSSTLVNGLIRRISTLTYHPIRSDNGLRVYCSASNVGQTHILTKQPQLNVLYRATGPTIDGYTNEGTYQVTENTTGSLTCRTTGGNPLPTLSWSCYSGSTSTVGTTGTTVVSTRTWTATRDTDQTCTCTSTQQDLPGTRIVCVQVEILYPPSTPVLKVNSISVDNTVKVIRNNNLRIQCNSSGKPTPIYTWTLPDNTQRQGEWLVVNDVQKSDKGQYTCWATNNPGSGQVTMSSSTTVEVQFGPTTPRIYYSSLSGLPISTNTPFNIVVGDSWPILCQSEGQPAPNYTWTIDNKQYTGQTTTLPAVYRNMPTTIECKADNVLEQTGSTGTTPKSSSSTVTMTIMYGPEVLPMTNRSSEEGTLFNYSCPYRRGNPVLTTVMWTRANDGRTWNSELLTISSVSKSDAVMYTCTVFNKMEPTNKNPVSYPKSGQLYLDVKYSPEQPTQLTHMEEFITTSKATIQWTPGFNGGPNQTFILLYKQLTDSEWNTISVMESGESIMNYTLTGLQSDTQYEVKIYAQNRVGYSSTTSSIKIRTLDAVAEKSTNTGSIIGGVVGGAAGLAIIGVLVVVFLRRYDFTKATKKNSNIESDRREHQQSNRTNEDAAVSYYNIGRDGPLDSQVNNETTYYNESVVPEYETLNQQKQDTTTYSSLKPSSGDQNKDNKENIVYENLQLRVI